MNKTMTLAALLWALAACSNAGPTTTPGTTEPDANIQAAEPADDDAIIEALDAPDATKAESVQVANGEQVVCRREATVGSRIGKRVCRTESQEEMLREQSQKEMDRLMDRQIGSDTAGSYTE